MPLDSELQDNASALGVDTPPAATLAQLGQGVNFNIPAPAMAPEVRNRVQQQSDPWSSSPLMEQTGALIRGGENPTQDPTAKNPYSSAGGPAQMIDDTYVMTMRQHHPEIAQGKSRDQILAMKLDPTFKDLNVHMGAEYTLDNMRDLQRQGLPVTPQSLAAAYRLGPGGAAAVLKAPPDAALGAVVPAALSPGNGDIAGLTVGQFLSNPYPRGGGSNSSLPGDMQMNLLRSSQEAQSVLDRMRTEDKAARAQLDKAAAGFRPFEVGAPPQKPDDDPLKAFGSVATLFAVLAAGLSKTPAVAAMNGLAGAINGAREHDWLNYEKNYRQWKDGTEYALKMHQQQSDDIKTALEMITSNVTSGTAMLHAVAATYDDPMLRQLTVQQDIENIHKLRLEREDKARQMQMMQPAQDAYLALQVAEGINKQSPTPEHQAQVEEARKDYNDKVKQMNDFVTATKGYGYRAAGSQTPAAVALRRYMDEHPDASAEDIQKFIVGFKEDAPNAAARKDRLVDLREAHEKNWREVNEDKTKNAREIAEERIRAASDWHEKQVDLAVRKLDQTASIEDRRQNERERHDKRQEEITNDWHLTQAEKDRLHEEENKRWHDLQDTRGYASITSREQLAEKTNEIKREHETNVVKIANNRDITMQDRDKRLADERERFNREREKLARDSLALRERGQEEREWFDHRKMDIENDKTINARERNERVDAERERYHTALLAREHVTAKEKEQRLYEEDIKKNPAWAGKSDSEIRTEANRRIQAARKPAEMVLSEDAVNMDATTLLLTGQMPAFGLGGAAARIQVMNRAAEMVNQPGADGAQHPIEDYIAGRATWKADASSLATITKISDAVNGFEDNMLRNMEIAEKLMSKGAGTSAGPVINRWLQAGRVATGDPDVAAFNAAMGVIAGEYGKIISGGSASIAATPEGAREEAAKWLDRGQSPAAIQAQFKVARADAANRNASLQTRREVIQGRLRNPVAGIGAQPAAQAPLSDGWSVKVKP